MYTKSTLGLIAAASLAAPAYAVSGNGVTTRYWDCCKPSCSWSGKAPVSSPALTCDANDNPLTDVDAKSGCDGGGAFTCTNYSPWAVNDNLAYGFAATSISGGTENSWCCGCYQLDFTSGPVAGKTMIVQSTNTGGDLGSNHFDILMPGGGVGIFDGCKSQFGQSLPGQQYGGISSRSECDASSMPASLRDGCYWRFDWFENADNPNVSFKQVACPAEILAVSHCKRDDDSSFPAVSVAGAAVGDAAKPSSVQSTAAAQSSQSTTTAAAAAATSATSTPAAEQVSVPSEQASAPSEPQTSAPSKGHGHGSCKARRAH
ncbi:RlpA-like double-psi beta-barrel-protein domain-containing protein-containing protein [Xylaria palmicola]|nr:RlpA-like double-psi beta-barrel-protein domain-containing protein-containing protein [Xylaria palmicola]